MKLLKIEQLENLLKFKRHYTHKLRHSQVSLLIYMGKTLEDIKVGLRHKDIRTRSNEYTHMYSLANDLTNFQTQNKENFNNRST